MNGLLYRSVQGAARALARASIAVVAISLVACGGGGSSGGDRRPDPPPVVVNPGTPMTGTPTDPTNVTVTPPTGTPTIDTPTTPDTPAPTAAPPAPRLSLNIRAIKTFRFSWLAVTGATEYQLFENPDGKGFNPAPIAIMPATVLANDQTVFLPSRMNAQYVLLACNSAGCSSGAETAATAVVSPTSISAAIGYVKPSNTVADLGATPAVQARNKVVALSADGKTLAFSSFLEDSPGQGVGAPQEIISNDREHNSGAVYILVNNDGVWSQQAYIKASNSRRDLYFGMAIALSADGNTLAVGATEETLFRTTSIANPIGAVYVFTRSGSAWTEQSPILRAANPGADDFFGFSLALAGDGNTLAVGAILEDGPDNDPSDNRGAVYVFTRSDGGWGTPTTLRPPSPVPGDAFGSDLSLNGDGQTLVVGIPGEDSRPPGVASGDFADSGGAFVFQHTAAGWGRGTLLKANDARSGDGFGSNVSLSKDGNTLAIGAGQAGIGPGNTTGPGAVYIFVRTDSNSPYTQQPALRPALAVRDDGDSFVAVDLSEDGNTLVVGALGESSRTMGLIGNELGSSAGEDDSAPRSGAAYVFKRNGTNWTQLAYLKASNTEAGDQFGQSVAISGDGNTVAVMAPNEASSATGIDGNQNDNSATGSGGAVYLY